jgi:hypothetical protein
MVVAFTACGSSNNPTDAGKLDAKRTDAPEAMTDGAPDTGPGGGGGDVPGGGVDGRDGGGNPTDGPKPEGGSNPDAIQPGSGGKTIGPAGDKVTSADGRVTLEVPAGAVHGLIPFTIQPSAMAPAGALGMTYDIGPFGTTFLIPARVIFRPSAADAAGGLGTLRVAVHGDGGAWTQLPGAIADTAAGTVLGSTTHLSTFGLVAGLCQACTPECDPATPACDYMTMGAGTGRCVMSGKGCAVCVPSCDSDGDGYCPPNAPGAFPGGDCDDGNPDVHPNALEICGNGKDDDCNGHQDEGCRACTKDMDCPSGLEVCTGGTCHVCEANCDPTSCRFGAIEGMPNSGVAGRCATYGRNCSRCVPACDMDGDGFCTGATMGDIQGGDCNDQNAAQNPGTAEICGNNVDDNCNGAVDEGCTTCTKDTDCPMQQVCLAGLCQSCSGSCDPATCAAPSRCVSRGNGCSACVMGCDIDGDGFCPGAGGDTDCDDSNPAVNPMATEICGNMKDDNCNGHADEGCRACTKAGDCAGFEDCVNGVCQICGTCEVDNCRFGAIENMPGSGVAGKCIPRGQGCQECVPMCDMDGDGFCPGSTPGMEMTGSGDCDDMDPKAHPGAQEVCGNSKDDDCNGQIDDGCLTCAAAATCGDKQSCSSGK